MQINLQEWNSELREYKKPGEQEPEEQHDGELI